VTGASLKVVINDQTSDGTSVIVADVVSKGPGWVAIHADNSGRMGDAIGHAAVKDGDNQNVVVQLEPGKATPTMYAMLHVDAGKVGTYEFPGPDVPAMLNGQMVAPSFKVTLGAASSGKTPMVMIHDQDVKSGKVIVDQVVSDGPGWVDVHIQNPDGTRGTDIGYSAVHDGVNQNVVVTIDPSKATAVMYAMLHKDAGEAGTFESPNPDVPVQVNGQTVMQPFNTGVAASGNEATPTSMDMSMTGSTPTSEASSMVMTTAVPGMQPVVKVSDQQIQNGMVMVEDVVSNGPGWIVIYSTKNGQPDQPIGYSPVHDGDNPNVQVQIDPSKMTDILYAQLHVDGGKVGTFEFPGPDAAVMIGVQMISGNFKALSGQSAQSTAPAEVVPSITVEDQQIHQGMVIVPKVVSQGESWLVIHPQTPDGQMGEYIGAVKVPDGTSTDVMVPVDVNRVTPTLYAMLHENNTKGDRPNFPGADVPVEVNGQMVAPTFKVLGALTGDVEIKVSNIPGVGNYLVDGRGISLYLYLGDQPGKSNCTGDCLKDWHPLLASGKLVPGDGVQVSRLGVIVLADGSRQITYSGSPLYYSDLDAKPGNINGQGAGGQWFLVQP
jgi:predicted lipoprotein with Yx(FWY)xxD motif